MILCSKCETVSSQHVILCCPDFETRLSQGSGFSRLNIRDPLVSKLETLSSQHSRWIRLKIRDGFVSAFETGRGGEAGVPGTRYPVARSLERCYTTLGNTNHNNREELSCPDHSTTGKRPKTRYCKASRTQARTTNLAAGTPARSGKAGVPLSRGKVLVAPFPSRGGVPGTLYPDVLMFWGAPIRGRGTPLTSMMF